MTEKASSSGEPHFEQDPLFGMGPGAYHETVRYLDPDQPPALYAAAEKPKKLEDLTAEEMIRIATYDGLVPDLYGHFDDKRRDFIREHDWTPYSEGEATRAIGGGLVNYLLGARDRGGLSAVRDVLQDVDRDRAQAVEAIDTLRLVQDVETGEFNPEWAKTNTYVRQTLARAILARNSLNLFEWPRHYDRRKKETKENQKVAAILLTLTDKLAGLDNQSMEHLLIKTLRHEQFRLKFASDQLEAASNDPKTEDLIAATKSRG